MIIYVIPYDLIFPTPPINTHLCQPNSVLTVLDAAPLSLSALVVVERGGDQVPLAHAQLRRGFPSAREISDHTAGSNPTVLCRIPGHRAR